MKYSLVCASALCATLAGCGGGGDTGGGSPAEPAPVIQFIGTLEPACIDCLPANHTLTIAPNTGAARLGSREIAKVELSVDQGPAQTLLAPNSKNASGQSTWVFNFSTATPILSPVPTHVCTPALSLEMTVTDVRGFIFKKYFRSCRFAVFGAFSDYGEKSATFSAASTAPTQAFFQRGGASAYLDDFVGQVGGNAATLTLNARDEDTLSAYAGLGEELPIGTTVSVSIAGDGGALASSNIAHDKNSYARTSLVCCGARTPVQSSAATDPKTLVFVVVPVKYGVPQGDYPFNVYFRVFDPASRTVVTEFRGVSSGYSRWPVSVRAGYELKLEASPFEGGVHVEAFIQNVPEPAALIRELGSANSNRTDAPARLTVFCCSP
ncbi:MAG: hypothetical protein ABL931_05735 [Usitatibacteraceae bacterium]